MEECILSHLRCNSLDISRFIQKSTNGNDYKNEGKVLQTWLHWIKHKNGTLKFSKCIASTCLIWRGITSNSNSNVALKQLSNWEIQEYNSSTTTKVKQSQLQTFISPLWLLYRGLWVCIWSLVHRKMKQPRKNLHYQGRTGHIKTEKSKLT